MGFSLFLSLSLSFSLFLSLSLSFSLLLDAPLERFRLSFFSFFLRYFGCFLFFGWSPEIVGFRLPVSRCGTLKEKQKKGYWRHGGPSGSSRVRFCCCFFFSLKKKKNGFITEFFLSFFFERCAK